MAFLPPIDLPDLSDMCPHWLDSVFRRFENIVDEEVALAAAEAELTHRSKGIAHQYSDITPIGRLNDGGDNMDDHEEEEEEEEGDPGDEEYESGAEGDMDDMDADDYEHYMDDGNAGLETSAGSPVTVSATITLPLPSTATTTSNTNNANTESGTDTTAAAATNDEETPAAEATP